MNPLQRAFGLLILAQAAHSVEEYLGRLWESFPPARILTGLFSDNREQAFIALNVALVGFGVWCFAGPVRRGSPSAAGLIWIWVVIELINGIVHPLWALRIGGYAPGVATAPVLLALALLVARRLLTRGVPESDPLPRRDAHAQQPAGHPDNQRVRHD
jgi:hypothetical protein